MSSALPPNCKAIVYSGPGKLTVQQVATPTAVHGSIVVRVLVSKNIPGLTVPNPSIPGARAIGRVAALGPDSTAFEIGQLVFLEPFVRARDNPNQSTFVWGAGVFGNDPAAIKLNQEVWNNGSWSEFVRAPLENCHPLNEKVLLGSSAEGGFGYSIAELICLPRHVIAYGGLRGIGLTAGETVIVAPATGHYTGAAVDVAIAMGARVIAVSRNLEVLQRIASTHPRVDIVQLKGNVEEDLASIKKFGPVDAYIDISPIAASDSTHVRSCIMAVKPYGRISLMGVILKDISIPYITACLNNLTIRGQYMYEREDVRGIIKLVEAGILKLGKSGGHQVVGEFKLEEWQKAFEAAEQNTDAGKIVALIP
ncbi:hypothetical protein B0O99DRAFT_650228 [Bisporella sp. PMI_857]|nr:hypothetical protein B0O99DRAFT_650228 [Bisporella sp. PMI_857]